MTSRDCRKNKPLLAKSARGANTRRHRLIVVCPGFSCSTRRYQLSSERCWVVGRWIDLKGSRRETRHGKTARQWHQRYQAFQPHRLFGSGIGFAAEALVCEQFARHGKARPLARICQTRGLARIYGINDRLIEADRK